MRVARHDGVDLLLRSRDHDVEQVLEVRLNLSRLLHLRVSSTHAELGKLTSQIRMSVATWSFLLRPVCSFPPMSLPMISDKRLSLAVWMSSSSAWITNWC